MPNIGLSELVIVLVIALVVFGPKRLPDMGRQLGKTIREFRDATSEIRSQIGIDDIADSVKDIKSGFSLTSTDAAGEGATAVAEPGAIASATDAGSGSMLTDATGAAPAFRNGPVATGEPPAAPAFRNGPVGTGAPASVPPLAGGASVAGAPAIGADEVAITTAADETAAATDGGVESFGKLTRRSASSSVRPTAG